ncbi:MAG: GNAT family protein [Candidatus Paceibacterota bacterium]
MIRPFEPSDIPALHALLTSNRWEYFIDPVIDEEGLKVRDEKYFLSETNQTLISLNNDGELKGYIRFFDIKNSDDDAPDFIVSVDENARGKGIGTELVREGVKYIFNKYDQIRRIEATTRIDNVPMQKVFEAAGFTHEATYRKAWKIRGGEHVDAFGYGILKEEVRL